jgi:hypothetical protein
MDTLLIYHQVIWSVLTFCLCKCNNVKQIYVLRFFIGEPALSSLGFHSLSLILKLSL